MSEFWGAFADYNRAWWRLLVEGWPLWAGIFVAAVVAAWLIGRRR